jgi:transcriptional antiterminator RfaH
MTAAWHVLHSKPLSEHFLCEQLRARELEAYCPQIRVRPANPRARKTQPYFPGYVFVRVALEQIRLSSLQWMPGATGLVSFGGQPAHVPEALIHDIRRRTEALNAAQAAGPARLQRGDPVTIAGGPFDGYEAIFESRLPGSERARVLLKYLPETGSVACTDPAQTAALSPGPPGAPEQNSPPADSHRRCRSGGAWQVVIRFEQKGHNMLKKNSGYILFALGLVLLVLSLAADSMGLGGVSGIGWKQWLGAAAGVILQLAGLWQLKGKTAA